MKNLFKILIIFTFASNVYAQNPTPKKGEYRKDDNLDKFAGTWEGSKGNESLRITLKKEKIYVKGMDFSMDVIIGWHSYTKNGKAIESSIAFAGSSYDENTTIMASSDGDKKLNFSVFRDLSRERTSSGELKLINSKEGVLTLRFNEQVLINKTPANPTEAIPTPSEWNMKKIE
ncbi:MAG: hypothetical protein ORN54_07685 [Cyclobacteriaceae bacterium]|nr:hypothetical protein [Cyclobacteriaceae bacterium]